MGVSPGTGAGIGIALALVIVFIVGPGQYYYRKRRRQQVDAKKYESRNAEVSEAGEDYFGGVKPQLDDTAVSPETAWRISRSTIDDGPTAIPEIANQQLPAQQHATQSRDPNIEIRHPTVLRPGPKGNKIQEADASGERRLAELHGDQTIRPPAELRADKSPPTDPTEERSLGSLAPIQVGTRSPSDDSMQLPALPGPILPPKNS